FFFQAEDGIRDYKVTGVQTCALPILVSAVTLVVGYAACRHFFSKSFSFLWALGWAFSFWPLFVGRFNLPDILIPLWECFCLFLRSEERRVGKDCRCWW